MREDRRICSKCGESYEPDVIFCPKDGRPLGGRKTEVADDPYLGLNVAGQFRIEQIIGIGAMGRVYRAHQSGIERDVAIKILHRDLLRNPTVIARFHREAKVASRLTHPNVVQVLMSGELERLNADVGGEAYLVMEYLDGISLRSALAAAGGAMPLPRALHVVLQVCDAVGEAHAQGIVHRDLKPENVMLVKRGDDKDFAKVLDFGVARIDFVESSVATQAGVIFGTARYISPEGAQGAPVGPAGDVYSIATMLFQCLSGQTPFDGESPVAILVKHSAQAPPDIRSLPRSSYVSEHIARVIADNLAKDPASRCRDARELGRAIARAARDSGLSPDDLVLRSTLLGDPGGALQLASIERTRAMNLTPKDAKDDVPRPQASKTEMMEPEAAPGGESVPDARVTPASEDAAAGHTASPEGAASSPSAEASAPRPTPVVPSTEPSAASETDLQDDAETANRVSTVEPTLSDEPARVLGALSEAAAMRDSLASFPSGALPVVPPRSSGLAAVREVRPDVASRLRPYLLPAAMLLLGSALVAGVAHRLGTFDGPDPSVEDFVAKANAAIAVSAWNAPPGDNVKDITDNALKRFPGAEAILAVRRDAARRLMLSARQARDEDLRRAEQYARLASELAPNSAEAATLVNELGTLAQASNTEPEAPASGPEQPVEMAEPETPPPPKQQKSAAAAPARPASGARQQKTGSEPAKAPPPSAPPPASEPVEPAEDKPKDPGRWL